MLPLLLTFLVGVASIGVYAYVMVMSAPSLARTVAFQLGTLLGGVMGSWLAGRLSR